MAYDEYKHAGSDEYKFIQMTDIDEQQPDAVLKGAEYVEYLGLYFNREKEAAAAIQHIVDNYMCTKKAVESVVLESAPKLIGVLHVDGLIARDGLAGRVRGLSPDVAALDVGIGPIDPKLEAAIARPE